MLVSKIIKFKQLIFLPLFVLFYSIDLKSSQSIITKALSHLQVLWGPYFQSPDSQTICLHLHGLLPWCLTSFLPCEAFSGLGWELPGRKRQSQRALEVVSWASAESLQSLHRRLWQFHMDLSLVTPWLPPPMTVPWQQLQLRPWVPSSGSVCLKQNC